MSNLRLNLCSGARPVDGFVNIDLCQADVILDLEKDLLPFSDATASIVTCMSAINYFSRARAVEIVRDVHRVLRDGGIARFGVQDLRILTKKYLERDAEFYFQRLPDGRERFEGDTFADKLNRFFNGYAVAGRPCRHVYDYESLHRVFIEAGFSRVEERAYQDSRISGVEAIDNRPEQMFFLEAVKG